MTEDEKRALLTFCGTLHAQAKQTDQMIIGRSPQLSPISNTIEQKFAQVLSTPAQTEGPPEQRAYAAQEEVPVPQNFVSVEQAARELESMQTQPVPFPPQIPVSPVLTDNSVEVLKEISLTLKRIADILDKND